jgi:hypothetical protein
VQSPELQTVLVQEARDYGMSGNWIQTPESSHVEAIRYEPETQDVYVRFQDDQSVYRYMGVPASVWDEFVSSGSKGRFVGIVLRRRFRYVKVE